jgi:uncharacterized protein (TIGR00725 family)
LCADYIAVVGPAEASPEQLDAAFVVGRDVASAGAILVCGGLGGVMKAACRGAVEAGGLTVGLLPGSDRRAANPWVRVAIPTGMGELRNGLVVRAADAIVAVGGSWGTLSEIALAVRTGTPVVGVGTWDLGREGVVREDDPSRAVERALALAGRRRREIGTEP